MTIPLGDVHPDNIELLEQYRQLFVDDSTKLDASWRNFFEAMGQHIENTIITNIADAYRIFGHLAANVYPQGVKQPGSSEFLPTDDRLKRIYCGRIGYEFYPYCSKEVCDYIVSTIEPLDGSIEFSSDKKQKILHLLNQAESFETFLHTKYVGQKRFSLEGAETLIPMLATFLEKDISDLIIGMPHRGRLNVLVNILKKSYGEIFSEFEDVAMDTFETNGDVKYHKGYSSKIQDMTVRLVANPSHLESVDAVVEGMARAIQTVKKDILKVVPVLVHGDAAVAGQGVVYETLQMSRLEGYKTGGTIHIIINNHIGFTTLPEDSRSTRYCTDIAKGFGIPVFHVNAEDPESCMYAMQLAYDIRQRFGIDVFIDLNCWRKYGHNESDEPSFTQPLLYQTIRKKASIRTQYHDGLVKDGVEVSELDEEFKNELQKAHEATVQYAQNIKKDISIRQIADHLFTAKNTLVTKAVIHDVVEKLTKIPEGFTLHPRLKTQIEARKKSNLQEIDWAFAEALAFGTLLQESVPIRLTGQDTRRGTFSQRHAMWVDQATANRYIPHANIHSDFEVVDSYLSEYAALAFEYGYSVARPEALVMWEAQFGDFVNGAQIVIDQYIAPGEQKWNVHSKLVLLLPHGYEGQGPEHSSARIERFLLLCAEDNMVVVHPTTPAQYFHVLRRQSQMQKPLIVFTPKGLLRSPQCVSSIDSFTKGTFKEIIDDTKDAEKVVRLIFCSGRIFYDLKPHAGVDTAIIRIEQLYPLHQELLKNVIGRYKNAKIFIWAQEEPFNMGPRGYIYELLQNLLPKNALLEYRGRTISSAPASGSHLVHEKEHEMILDSLFKGTL